jgi:predicted nucleic acid-binding protein
VKAVLDASVFVATLSPAERHHEVAKGMYALRSPTTPFLVPAIFRLEVLSALTRRGAPSTLIDTSDALIRGPSFLSVPISGDLLDCAAELARKSGLRAYDALYAAVAWRRQATLLTLDDDVVDRLKAAFPDIEVRSEGATSGEW